MKRTIAALCMILLVMCTALAGCSADKPGSSGSKEEKQEKIGVIGAMDVEVENLLKATADQNVTSIAGMDFHDGTIDDTNVVIVKCGMGKVNAGICASTLINEYGCSRIINTGVAGSLDDQLHLGDIVVSTDAVQHDYDVSPIGFEKGEIPYTGRYSFPADESMRAAAVEAVKAAAPDVKISEGRICSGDQFIATKEQKEEITSNFGGLCCEMEGAAVAQACYLNKTPFVIIRSIADNADKDETADFKAFEEEAADICTKAVLHMIESM